MSGFRAMVLHLTNTFSIDTRNGVLCEATVSPKLRLGRGFCVAADGCCRLADLARQLPVC